MTTSRGAAAVQLRTALWRLDGYLCAEDTATWRRFRATFEPDIDTARRAANNLDQHVYISTENLCAAAKIAGRLADLAEEAEVAADQCRLSTQDG